MSKKHRVLLRKLITKDQSDSQLNWPTLENDTLNNSNIFISAAPEYPFDGPLFDQDKSVVKRSIVGKPESFYRMSNLLGQHLRFMQPAPQAVAKRIKRSRTTANRDDLSSASSSQRQRKASDHADRKPEGVAFEVVDKYELLKAMKKMNEILLQNEQKHKKQLQKLNISEKLLETHDQRVLEKFDKQIQQWDKLSTQLNRQSTKQRLHRKSHKSTATLIESQDNYRHRVESLKLFESLQLEESRQPVISWHTRLRSKHTPLTVLEKQEQAKLALKHQLLEKIPHRKLLQIANPAKVVNEIGKQPVDLDSSLAEISLLRLKGKNLFQLELDSLKRDNGKLSQQFYLFKNKEVSEEQIL